MVAKVISELKSVSRRKISRDTDPWSFLSDIEWPSYLGFKTAVETNDERVVSESEDVPLREHLLDLIPQDEVVLQ